MSIKTELEPAAKSVRDRVLEARDELSEILGQELEHTEPKRHGKTGIIKQAETQSNAGPMDIDAANGDTDAEDDVRKSGVIRIDVDRFDLLKETQQKVRWRTYFFRTLLESGFVTLVSRFEVYVGKLITELMTLKPKILYGSSADIKPNELAKYTSMEEFWSDLREREAEKILRGSHEGHLNWLRKHNIGVPKDGVVDRYLCLVQKRHLFVHQNGVVNKSYLDFCRSQKMPIDGLAIGERLRLNKKDILNASADLIELAIILFKAYCDKVEPGTAIADGEINNRIFRALELQDYSLALQIADIPEKYGFQINCDVSEQMIRANKAIALYGLDKHEDLDTLLSEWRVSALSDEFKLARAVLKKDWPQAATLVRNIGIDDSKVSRSAYQRWPLFRWFRETQEFRDAYFDVFDKKFDEEITDVDADEENPASLAEHTGRLSGGR
jgi:hypothetical protein